MTSPCTVGVLALQGAYTKHAEVFTALGATVREVRLASDLAGCDALAIPGGESTTMGKLLRSAGLYEPLRDRLRSGMPAMGTCAGLILLASEVADPGPNDEEPFGIVDTTVRRNAFGRQVDSFEADLDVAGFDRPFHAVFIRAPVIERAGAGVEPLAWQNRRIVMARQGPVLVCAFHPELTEDARVHELFLNEVYGGSP